jgi:hypothetical protein
MFYTPSRESALATSALGHAPTRLHALAPRPTLRSHQTQHTSLRHTRALTRAYEHPVLFTKPTLTVHLIHNHRLHLQHELHISRILTPDSTHPAPSTRALYSAPEHVVPFARPASTVSLTTTAIICAHELHISRVVKAEPGTKINVKDEVIAIDEDEVRETVPGTPETVDWDPDNDNDAITVSDDIIVMDSQEEEVSQQTALSGPSKCQPEYTPASAAASKARASAVAAASASASASASAAASVAAAVPPRVLPAALSRKNSYVALLERKGPQRIGERALPVGSAGCLEGLRFVVTGVRAHPPTSRVCTSSVPTSPRTRCSQRNHLLRATRVRRR